MRLLPVFAFVSVLGACGDPLAGIGRLEDLDVAPAETPAAAALPQAEEIAREGFFGTAAAQGEVPVDLPEIEAAPEAPGGVLRGLIRRVARVDPAEAIAADVARAQSGLGAQQVAQAAPPAAPAGAVAPAPQALDEEIPVEEETPVALAALTEAEAAPARRGLGALFAGRAPAQEAQAVREGPDGRDVPYGTVLAFGEIARVCDAKGQNLGARVEGSSRRGFALYDTNPDTRERRTFYVTGFGDDCPRQFTAANALFGVPSFYEQLRFGPAGQHLPYAATDSAYDEVKRAVCRAAKDAPCGAQIDRMDAQAAFVSAYEFHEENAEWKEFFVNDGAVMAAAVKSFQ